MTDRIPIGNQQDTDRIGLSVPQAARRLDITPDAVRARLHRGTLAGEKRGGEWRVWLPDGSPDPALPGDRQDADRTDPVGKQDPTGHRQDTEQVPVTGLLASKDAQIAQLAGETAFLRDQLDQRSRELAAERERADILHREALSRIPALGAGDAATPDDRAAASTPAPVAPWWRCLWGGR